ncbi:hypothetical protein Daesc_003119 [Daldinia eschscholtzii]|uniref:C4-dicarboxylate transporter/malic acid transport protein n=1 Tax=Daldinia eschscholtzii TaxID=292717 RepID=A0AAX6MS34_9PEZI
MNDDEQALYPGYRQNGTGKLGVRDRVAHFTWANFACTQSTGGIAILLSMTPHQFRGLQTAGVVISILNVVLFAVFCAGMLVRFVLHPRMVKRSFTNPPEMFFFGSFWLSIATGIICMQRFGVPHAGDWLVVAIRVLFWMYAAGTLVFATVIWVLAAAAAKAPVKMIQINPAAFLMIFNTMLTGTIAGSIAQSQPPEQRLPIIVAGVAFQGLGWINGLGSPDLRPGLFMPVGSAGYTVVSLIGCARYIPQGYGFFAEHPGAADVLQVLATWVGIFLWLFAFWLFGLALVANLPLVFPYRHLRPRMSFTLSWWGLIFPNVGFAIATIMIGEEFRSDAVLWVASAMTVLLFAAWLMDLGLHVKALVTGQIMWPGKDEDVLKDS